MESETPIDQESLHSLVTRYPGLELGEDQRERSPTEEQVPNADEGVIGKRLREDVSLLHLGPTVTEGSTRWIGLQERPKVMALQCDVLRARSELVGLCHADTGLIVFVNSADESWRTYDDREELVNLLEESHQLDGFSERLGESDEFRLCCAESDLCLEFGDCQDGTISVANGVVRAGENSQCRQHRPCPSRQQSRHQRRLRGLWTCRA